jgi:hypothetical protein
MLTTDNQITRGFFGLGFEPPITVDVKSNKDFLVYIWVRNDEVHMGSVQIFTPPSHFTDNEYGELPPRLKHDDLTFQIPAQTAQNLGCIGARGGETIRITSITIPK